MASALIGALRVALGIDTAAFEAGLTRAKKQVSGFGSSLSGFAAAFNPVAMGAAVGTAAVAGFALAMRQAAAAAQWADDLSAQANKIGITAESLQGLRQAAEAVDIPMASLDAGMQALNGTLGALKLGIGDGKIRKAFEELGISQEQLGSMRDASDLLPVLADKIRGVGTQAEQVLIAKKLGIEELLPLLQQGSAGIQAMTDRYRELGLVLNESTVQHLADMNEEMRLADERSKIAGMTLGSVMTPALVAMKDALATATVEMAKFLDQFNTVANRSDETLKKQLANREKALERFKKTGASPGVISGLEEQIAALKSALLPWDKLNNPDRTFKVDPGSRARSSGGGGGRSRSSGGSGTTYGTIAEMTSDPSMGGQNWDFAPAGDKLKDVIITSTYQGVTDGLENTRAEITDSYRDAISGGLYAAVYGGGKGLMEYLADTFRRKLIDGLANNLANILTSGFGGSGSSGTGIGGTILNFGKKLFGFANGGSFQVGGVGGIDSQLVAFKASPNERVSITKPGQDMGAGGAIAVHVTPSAYFDVAVQRIAAPMAASAAMGGAAIAERRMQRRSRRAI
jgi:hypothetical protein